MKTLLLALASITVSVLPSAATDLRAGASSYSWSGTYYRSTGSVSPMYNGGLGYGYYRYGYLQGVIRNYSSYRSGTVVGNLMLAPYYGATTGYTTYSAGWGPNYANVFYPYEGWNTTKYGYRKVLNRSGYPAFVAYEFNGYGFAPRSKKFYSNYTRF